jgi:hypothetical protein
MMRPPHFELLCFSLLSFKFSWKFDNYLVNRYTYEILSFIIVSQKLSILS